MNKKIVMSLAVIAAATAVMAGGTIAYFSDTETSSGNTFTAGNIDLKIDSECYFGVGGNLTACPNDAAHGNWALTDLESGVHKFFNYDDIKPGSWGENTISLHLTSNPAWAWMKIEPTADLENGCNEPEAEVDVTCADPGEGDGELAGALSYLIWQDTADNTQTGGKCNNILDSGEIIFKNGKIGTCEVVKLNETCGPACSDCDPLQPTKEDDPYCVGMMWCAGNWVSDSTGYHCDGSAIGNEAQGDSMKLDIEFDVVQSMNNLNGDGGPVCQ